MAFIYNTNNISSSAINGIPLYALKETLISAGWVLRGSGDGTTNYDNASISDGRSVTDYISSSATMYNNRAWFRLRTPTTLSNGKYRELTIQYIRGYPSNPYENYYYIRMKYSKCTNGEGFYNGTISANSGTTPTSNIATDEFIVYGSAYGSDTGSTGLYPFSDDLTGQGISVPAFNSTSEYWSTAAENSAPYSFYLISHTKTTKALAIAISFFPVDNGTYNAGDTEPYIFSNFGEHKSILGVGTVNEALVALTPNKAPNCGQDSVTNNDVLLPCEFYRLASATAPRGWKGASSYVLTTTAITSRETLDTFNINSTRDKILLYRDLGGGNICSYILPWDGSVPLF